MDKSLKAGRFLCACQRKPVDATPIWMMRQAGRALPAYRELRSRFSFLQLMDDADLCARVTLMPLEVLDVDAAIMFADLMTPVSGLGIRYDMVEGTGPLIPEPVTSLERVNALRRVPISEAVPELLKAIKIVRGEVEGKVPLLGFAGAPFTIASYLIQGGPSRDFSRVKAVMRQQPAVWHGLMQALVPTLVEYLEQQVHCGAQAFQIFDSWVGELSAEDYRQYVLPYTHEIFSGTDRLGVPRIHFGTGSAREGLIEAMSDAGGEVIGVDWRLPLDEAWRRAGHDRAIQGNLNPEVLLQAPEAVRACAREVLRAAGGRPGHIFNLGHGVLPNTPLANMQVLVETVHSF